MLIIQKKYVAYMLIVRVLFDNDDIDEYSDELDWLSKCSRV